MRAKTSYGVNTPWRTPRLGLECFPAYDYLAMKGTGNHQWQRKLQPISQDNICTSSDGDAAFRLYLREINAVKLLTPHAETALASRAKKGDKEAREKLIKANLGLVVKIARDHEGLNLPLLDLVSEGNLGLIEAVERFDPARAGKLATSASRWIKRSITRALAGQSQTNPPTAPKCLRSSYERQPNLGSWSASRRTTETPG